MTARYCCPAFAGPSCSAQAWVKTDGIHRTPLQKLWYRRVTVPGAEDLRPRAPRQICPKARGRPRPQKQHCCLTPLHDRSLWSATSEPRKDFKPILVIRSHCGQDGRAPNLPKGVESKVGRAVHCARRAGHPDQASKFESCFPRPYGRGYAHLQCCSSGL